ncbi:MAG: methionine aminotransferase [Crocinitomicaceae bacterium]|nr:methionine aminotransferase [Crocinitomicaceae bacterium]
MSKLPNVGTTIFSVMSKLAAENKAINLSQGFPNFPIDPALSSILEAQANESVHQYMPMPGSPELLSQVASLIDRQYGRSISESKELLITAGATQGIFTTILALIDKGDEVIILDPSYDCYEPAVLLAGGIPVRIPLSEVFLPDWDRIKDEVSDSTRMIITNNPHNPSGRVWSIEDMTELEALMMKNSNLLLMSDEVYEFITFDQKHLSAHLFPSLFDRCITISSFGKTFHITGWKMGYLSAPESLMKEIKKVHQFNVFSVNSVAQATLTRYLENFDVNTLGAFYEEKRDTFRNAISSSKFELLPCEGTYFQTASYAAISDMSDVDFCTELTIKYGVATIPISVFNSDARDQKIIRFCFAKDEATLLQAATKLCKI